jgi:hypothetical protein
MRSTPEGLDIEKTRCSSNRRAMSLVCLTTYTYI